ncbi:MAG: glycosyltransferase [Flavobacteriales bacterium]|nr:glycosyltransferase [Flavobacteriales bacterium]NNK80686.1 glycosyltransferase [Flavobacteriales bacterium]
MTIVVLIFSVSYVFFGILLCIGWSRANEMDTVVEQSDLHESVSIVIPFRNEEEHIERMLLSLLRSAKDSSLVYELILIDDHSTDSSNQIVEKVLHGDLCVKLLKNRGQGKLEAIKTGLSSATNQLIVSLDSDTMIPKSWASELGSFLSRNGNRDLYILPVIGLKGESLSSRYAALDFMSLIGLTFATAAIGRPVMANGAHLAYRKASASWPSGIVSGDDVFLLHNVKKKGRIAMALRKGVIISTEMPDSWMKVVDQRTRWASKNSRYRDLDTIILGWYIVLVNVLFWVLFCLYLLDSSFLSLFLTLFISKVTVDFVFLTIVAQWFGKLDYLKIFPLAWPLNSLMYPIITLRTLFTGFSWKGRVYR